MNVKPEFLSSEAATQCNFYVSLVLAMTRSRDLKGAGKTDVRLFAFWILLSTTTFLEPFLSLKTY